MPADAPFPELPSKGPLNPVGGRAPKRVQMLKTVTADPMPGIGFDYLKDGVPLVALIDQVLPCTCSLSGAVAVILPDGSLLGVKPDEFKVVD